MSVLVIGLSHESAPVAVLERAAVSGDTLTKLLSDLTHAEPVAEAFTAPPAVPPSHLAATVPGLNQARGHHLLMVA